MACQPWHVISAIACDLRLFLVDTVSLTVQQKTMMS
jgi:hypothetical protein